MKIHVALQNDSVKTHSVKTLGGHRGAISSGDAAQNSKRMPYKGARSSQKAYMTVNMHPTKKHLPPQTIAPFVPGTVND
jgi:hypothetical protein